MHTFRLVVGWLLLASPFIAISGVYVATQPWLVTFRDIAVVAVVLGPVLLGIRMVFK